MRYFFQGLFTIVLISISSMSYAQCDGPVPMVCDADGDFDVDADDIQSITLAKGMPATQPFDVRDVDGDGSITLLDARQCAIRCNEDGCAVVLPTTEISEEEVSQYGSGLTGLRTEDSSGTGISVFLPAQYGPADVVVTENVDPGNIGYTFVTSKAIQIQLPREVVGRQLVVFNTAESFEYIYQFAPLEGRMDRLPFILQEDGSVLIRPRANDGLLYIALVY